MTRSPGVTLSGITWDHSRGLLPLLATAQRFEELHPGVTITWGKRSLQAFADAPIEDLAQRFDLLIVDHPFVGFAGKHPTLVPLDQHLPAPFLADQAANSVGASHASYADNGHQWALAVDAAAPVSAHRPDLLERFQVELPRTWEDLVALAQRGLVVLPAIPVDALMHTYMLCIALGSEPGGSPDGLVDPQVGATALAMLRELVFAAGLENLQRNPIRVYEAMVGGDGHVYCPFAYGYSNYARPSYARAPLRFGGLIDVGGRRLRSALGGTGLAISRGCRGEALDIALAYAAFVASPECQRGLYVESGGQPGHRTAWLDPEADRHTGDFFRRTLPTVDEAYLRPRFDGYIPFQDEAGEIVHAYLRDGGDSAAAVANLNELYREARPDA